MRSYGTNLSLAFPEDCRERRVTRRPVQAGAGPWVPAQGQPIRWGRCRAEGAVLTDTPAVACTALAVTAPQVVLGQAGGTLSWWPHFGVTGKSRVAWAQGQTALGRRPT